MLNPNVVFSDIGSDEPSDDEPSDQEQAAVTDLLSVASMRRDWDDLHQEDESNSEDRAFVDPDDDTPLPNDNDYAANEDELEDEEEDDELDSEDLPLDLGNIFEKANNNNNNNNNNDEDEDTAGKSDPTSRSENSKFAISFLLPNVGF